MGSDGFNNSIIDKSRWLQCRARVEKEQVDTVSNKSNNNSTSEDNNTNDECRVDRTGEVEKEAEEGAQPRVTGLALATGGHFGRCHPIDCGQRQLLQQICRLAPKICLACALVPRHRLDSAIQLRFAWSLSCRLSRVDSCETLRDLLSATPPPSPSPVCVDLLTIQEYARCVMESWAL